MASGIIERKYPEMVSASATDLIGAQDFYVNVCKQGNLAMCSYTLRYGTQLNAGTEVFKLPYLPTNSFFVMVMSADGTSGFPLNVNQNGVAKTYNVVTQAFYYEGSFVYFTDA